MKILFGNRKIIFIFCLSKGHKGKMTNSNLSLNLIFTLSKFNIKNIKNFNLFQTNFLVTSFKLDYRNIFKVL